MAYIYNIGCIV